MVSLSLSGTPATEKRSGTLRNLTPISRRRLGERRLFTQCELVLELFCWIVCLRVDSFRLSALGAADDEELVP